MNPICRTSSACTSFKLIVDLATRRALLDALLDLHTAESGDYTRGKRVITRRTRANMPPHPRGDPVR